MGVHRETPEKFVSEQAWEDYLYWLENDRKTLKRTNALIRDTERTPYEGIGKPEPLRHQRSGYWSRRITGEHRFVYKVMADQLWIAQLRNHY